VNQPYKILNLMALGDARMDVAEWSNAGAIAEAESECMKFLND
jgi:hypothetical protein